MQPKKLTPLQILQMQKNNLQAKSNELAGTIENRARYVQQHFVPLLRNNVVESAVSKLPPQLRSLAGNLFLKEKQNNAQDSSLRKVTQGIAVGVMELAPFFLRGKKGAVISILLKQVVKWII